MKYFVLEYVEGKWVTSLETTREVDAVAKHRQLQKEGKIAIIDYDNKQEENLRRKSKGYTKKI